MSTPRYARFSSLSLVILGALMAGCGSGGGGGSAAAPAIAPSVSGSWSGTYAVSTAWQQRALPALALVGPGARVGGARSVTFTVLFTESAGAVTGFYQDSTGDHGTVTGTRTGNALALTVTFTAPASGTLTITGTVADADDISGSVVEDFFDIASAHFTSTAALVMAQHRKPAIGDAPTTGPSIVGAWDFSVDVNSFDAGTTVFMPNGTYFMTQKNPDAGISGEEYGFYTFDGSKLRVFPVVDHNGAAGWSDIGLFSTFTFTDANTIHGVDENTPDGPYDLNRLTGLNGLAGAWGADVPNDGKPLGFTQEDFDARNPSIIFFRPDSTYYVFSNDSNATASAGDGAAVGPEKGTIDFALDIGSTTDGTVTATATYDNNGDNGLATPPSTTSPLFNIHISGNTYTSDDTSLTEGDPDKHHTFTRVGAP